jgi:hypothetical protein
MSQKMHDMQFSGSTPGDDNIKLILGIPVTDSVDFMRWELNIENDTPQLFNLSITYGLAKPNTNGFENPSMLTFKGKSETKYKEADNFSGQVFNLISKSFTGDTLTLAKLNKYLLHILTPDYRLMVGNGGWSYTLNSLDEKIENPGSVYSLIPQDSIIDDSSSQIIFDGRSPCIEISEVYGFRTNSDCFKLKWRITLNRDPVSFKPSSYKIERSDIRNTGSITGAWTITALSDSAVIYELDPDKPENSIHLLVGDLNVLFFLDKNNRLFKGNRDFSYTLNRKNPV